jgi:hypothetical protein
VNRLWRREEFDNRARVFDMNVVFYDPQLSIGAELSFGFTRVGQLKDLLKVADVISIHAPPAGGVGVQAAAYLQVSRFDLTHSIRLC